MKKIFLFGLLVSSLAVSACGIKPRTDGKTGVKVIIGNLDSKTTDGEGVSQRAQGMPAGFYLSLKVSAPDLSPPLIYENPGYLPGNAWEVLVPNGTKRTFEVAMYDYSGILQADSFSSVTLYKQSPVGLGNVFDLNGSPITLTVTVVPETLTASVGTVVAGNTGFLRVVQGATPVYLKNCGYSLQAFLLDPDFPGMEFGPITVNLSGANTAQYLISTIPQNRPLQILFTRTDMGWAGLSPRFTLATGATPITTPLSANLYGWKDFRLEPAHILIADSDSAWSHPQGTGTIKAVGGWGNASGQFYEFPVNALVTGGTYSITYKSLFTYPVDLLDQVTVTRWCLGATEVDTFTAHRYKAPLISWISSPIMKGSPLTIYGYNFENTPTDSRVSIGATLMSPSLYFTTGYAYYPHTWSAIVSSYSMYYQFGTGTYPVKVHNYRTPGTDPMFPSFTGFWSDTVLMIQSPMW